MKQHLWLCLWAGVAGLNGCRHVTPQQYTPKVGTISSQGFVREWRSDYGQLGTSITDLNVINGKLIAYTKTNQAYWMTADNGSAIAQMQVTAPGHGLLPPVMLGDNLVIPTTSEFEMFDKNGGRIASVRNGRVFTSGAATAGDTIYIGVSAPGSGRLARILLTPQSAQADWEAFSSAGIIAAPVVVADNVYAGTLDGSVYALSSNRLPLWGLPNDVFKTDGPITGDLAADDNGVYVASQDQKLYCLDRLRGKIKWSYYAGVPLVAGPLIVGNMILQPLPGNGGMVAINKNEGDAVRKPLWKQPMAQQLLMADDDYVYVRSGSQILALDKASGEIKFHSTRTDLKAFATAPKASLIYAATRNNSILGIKPITKPGISGELVDGAVGCDWMAYVPSDADTN